MPVLYTYDSKCLEHFQNVGLLVSQDGKELIAMQETQAQFLGQEDPLENGMATHSRILGLRIPWTEEFRWLPYIGSQSIRHNYDFHSLITPRMWMLSQATSLSFRISSQTSTNRSSIFPTLTLEHGIFRMSRCVSGPSIIKPICSPIGYEMKWPLMKSRCCCTDFKLLFTVVL